MHTTQKPLQSTNYFIFSGRFPCTILVHSLYVPMSPNPYECATLLFHNHSDVPFTASKLTIRLQKINMCSQFLFVVGSTSSAHLRVMRMGSCIVACSSFFLLILSLSVPVSSHHVTAKSCVKQPTNTIYPPFFFVFRSVFRC
jgi:hypothetical protein